MNNPIRVLIVDDQILLRSGLRLMLNSRSDLKVVGEVNNGQEAVDFVARHLPDVVLMDVQMPIMDGITATRLIRAQHPNVQVIILTAFNDDVSIFQGIQAGALGYLLKGISDTEELVKSVYKAALGESILEPSVAARIVAEFAKLSSKESRRAVANARLIEPLNPRQLDILTAMAEGKTNQEIAKMLFLSEGTVKNHITSILDKLDVQNRAQAVSKAQEMGLV